MAGAPISPRPVTKWRPEFLPAYLSNGLIGVRVGKYPPLEGLAIVSGLAAIHPKEKVEGFARAPYPFAGDILIDGEPMSGRTDEIHFVRQRYDFARGELHTELRFVCRDVTATLEILSFCSRTHPTVVAQETRVTVDRACRLAMVAKLDPSGVDGEWLLREPGLPATEAQIVDGVLLWQPPGGLTTCGGAYWTEFAPGDGARMTRDEHTDRAPLATTYEVKARPERAYTIRQVASLVPNDFHSAPHRQAARMVEMAATLGFDALRSANAREWDAIWRGRVVLLGADRRWQELADAAYFYLHSSAHRSSLFSTSMFGLAYWPNYHYYRGQVMWDIEAFAHPVLALTQPDAAEALLDFRYDHLQAAERNAAMNGYAGAQFPWAATSMHGDEGLRTSAPLVLFEQHVGLAIALAFARQAHVNGERDYAERRAWPVLESVSRWIESRWIKTARGRELVASLGIAEQRTAPVDNPAYVAMAARRVLEETASFAEKLSRGSASRWRTLASEIRIPIDERRMVVKSHETFSARATGRAAATPEPLAGIFPVGYQLGADVERDTIRFYLDRVDPYLGSPMLPPVLGVHAAWIGDRDLALRLLEAGYAEYVFEPFTETDEFSRVRFGDQPRKGPFTANLAGFLLSCLLGYTGLQIHSGPPESWAIRKPSMPQGWDGVEVDQLQIRGRAAHLVARQGDERAKIETDHATSRG
jgi:trehalose/maltose hydrolase-like predicted phosphorylase